MAMTVQDVGDTVRLGNSSLAVDADGNPALPFATPAGVATDTSPVTLTVQRPDETLLIYGYPGAGPDDTLVREVEFPPRIHGRHREPARPDLHPHS